MGSKMFFFFWAIATDAMSSDSEWLSSRYHPANLLNQSCLFQSSNIYPIRELKIYYYNSESDIRQSPWNNPFPFAAIASIIHIFSTPALSLTSFLHVSSTPGEGLWPPLLCPLTMLIRRAGAPRRAPNQEETWCEIKFVGHVKHLLSKQHQGLCCVVFSTDRQTAGWSPCSYCWVDKLHNRLFVSLIFCFSSALFRVFLNSSGLDCFVQWFGGDCLFWEGAQSSSERSCSQTFQSVARCSPMFLRCRGWNAARQLWDCESVATAGGRP